MPTSKQTAPTKQKSSLRIHPENNSQKSHTNISQLLLFIFQGLMTDILFASIPAPCLQQFSRHLSDYITFQSSQERQLQTMGPSFSTKAKKKPLSSTRTSNLSLLYHTKILSQNRKSLENFRRDIDGLLKKTSCLSFAWAKGLNHDLAHINIDKLYSEYERVLQQNCRRQGKNELIFYAMKIRTAFISEITLKYHLNTSILSIAQLKALIFECKCYLMVVSWFHKISSLADVRSKDHQEAEREGFGTFGPEEKVFGLLVQAAGKCYVEFLQKEQISNIWGEDYQNNGSEQANQQIVVHLRALRACRKFQEKEEIISKMQVLMSGEGKEESLDIVQKVVGKSQVFAHLLIIRQLGSLDVSALWQQIYGSTYDHLLK